MSLSNNNIERVKAVDFNTVIEAMEDSELYDRLADVCLQAMDIEFNIDNNDDCELHKFIADTIENGAVSSLLGELHKKDLLKNS